MGGVAGVVRRATGALRRTRLRCVAAKEGTTVPRISAKRTRRFVARRARFLPFLVISNLQPPQLTFGRPWGFRQVNRRPSEKSNVRAIDSAGVDIVPVDVFIGNSLRKPARAAFAPRPVRPTLARACTISCECNPHRSPHPAAANSGSARQLKCSRFGVSLRQAEIPETEFRAPP